MNIRSRVRCNAAGSLAVSATRTLCRPIPSYGSAATAGGVCSAGLGAAGMTAFTMGAGFFVSSEFTTAPLTTLRDPSHVMGSFRISAGPPACASCAAVNITASSSVGASTAWPLTCACVLTPPRASTWLPSWILPPRGGIPAVASAACRRTARPRGDGVLTVSRGVSPLRCCCCCCCGLCADARR